MKWKNKFKDSDFDPKEVVEDNFKYFTYEELFEISNPLDENLYQEKYRNWNKFSVSSTDDFEQIFYDIANSKKARKEYRKANFMIFLYCLIKPLYFLFFLFSAIGLIMSKFMFFLFELDYWKIILASSLLTFTYNFIVDSLFKNYIPNEDVRKIDKSYKSNKTPPFTIESYGVKPRYISRGGVFFTPLNYVKANKPQIKSKYHIYKAFDNNNYLIDIDADGRYFSIRNWYLTAKYIAMKEIEFSNLKDFFKDEFFIYLTLENYKEEKLKLKRFFSINFSLNFPVKFNIFFGYIYWIRMFVGIILILSIW